MDTGQQGVSPYRPSHRWLRYAPPVAALFVAFVLQVVVVTDVVGTALADRQVGTGEPWIWYALAAGLGVAVATSLEAGAAYLMGLYDRHLIARDSVWQLRLGMLLYVAVSAVVIHWWLGHRGLPEMIAWVLAGMSASALWLWSRGSRWAQRREMIAAGQIDPALPRLPTVSKVLHPIRWIITVWLISWEPVATTAEARDRYQAWQQRRKGTIEWTTTPSSSLSSETGGGSRSASGSGTSTSPHPIPTLTPTAGASGAASSPRGGKSSTPPSTRRSSKTTRKATGSQKRTDTELITRIRENSWQQKSLNFLASELRVSKSRATGLRDKAQRELSLSPPDPAPTPVPSTNGQPPTTTQVEAVVTDAESAA